MQEDLIAQQASERIERMLAEAALFRKLIDSTTYRFERRSNPITSARRSIAHALVAGSHALLALSEGVAPYESCHGATRP